MYVFGAKWEHLLDLLGLPCKQKSKGIIESKKSKAVLKQSI